MTHFDYHKFVHPVPDGYTIPKGTPVRMVDTSLDHAETFFTAQYGLPTQAPDEVAYYLDYDITRPKLPEEINSVIYNVRTVRDRYALAVYRGSRIWSAFSDTGECVTLFTPEIKYFDTTPPKEEARDDDE